MVESVRELMQDIVVLIADHPGSIDEAMRHHRRIVAAIAEHDPARAAAKWMRTSDTPLVSCKYRRDGANDRQRPTPTNAQRAMTDRWLIEGGASYRVNRIPTRPQRPRLDDPTRDRKRIRSQHTVEGDQSMTHTKLTRRGLMGAGAGLGAAALIGKGAMAAPAPSWKFVPTSSQEEITLNVFVHANHPFDRVKPLYEAAYPNVTLNMMEQNDVAILRAALAAGEGVPDIFWPEIEMVQELGKTGILLDVTDIVEANAENLSPGKTAECFIPSTGWYAAFPAISLRSGSTTDRTSSTRPV